mmetsp:Transcript_44573/g.103029  ORF Transcript_44573/g.103029 Transcript_44573/m.103029 type:complete len:367 (+) Transcript_44573:88-1188(+)
MATPAGYRPIRVLGTGASARVTLVQDEADGLYYASKAVDLTLMTDDELRTLEVEVDTHRALMPHAHIIGLKESVVEAGTMHIVLEYADGGDLAELLHRQRVRNTPFAEAEALRIVAALALALKHCHNSRVLHRDVKARNVFLSADRRRVKLGDFGIAKALTVGSELATSQVGTPYYMAPEVCNAKPYDARCDVWALGVIAYELAALSRPFEATGYSELMLKIARGSYAPLPKHVSRPMRELIAALLSPNAQKRPTAADVCAKPVLVPYIRALIAETEAESEQQQPGGQPAPASSLSNAAVPMPSFGRARVQTAPGSTPRMPGLLNEGYSAVGGQSLAVEGGGLVLPPSRPRTSSRAAPVFRAQVLR